MDKTGKGTLFDNTINDCPDFGVDVEEGGTPTMKANSLPNNNRGLSPLLAHYPVDGNARP